MTHECQFCKANLAPALSGFYFCETCKAPYFSGDNASPFAVFSLPERFELNETDLEETYFSLSRRMHPDRFATGAAALKAQVQGLSALLNQAYLALRSPESRLEALLKLKGFINESERTESKQQIPMELAEEFFEIQELLMDEPKQATERIQKFRINLETKEKALAKQITELALAMDWTAPNSADVEKILNARKERSYLRSMQENLARIGGHSHV